MCLSRTRPPLLRNQLKSRAGWGFRDEVSDLGDKNSQITNSVTENPYASPRSVYIEPKFPDDPSRCYNQPTSVDAILGHSWKIWKSNLGLLIGTTFVTILILGCINAVLIIVIQAVAREDLGTAQIINFVGELVSKLASTYLSIGQARIALKLARFQRAEFGDLFNGGDCFFSLVVAWIIAWIGFVIGLVLLIIPGILLYLAYWPFCYFIIDRKAGVIDSFSLATEITKNNWGTAFGLWFVSAIIMIVGFLALCVGVIAAAPLVGVVWATAYLMMSGQLSPFPRREEFGDELRAPKYA